MFIIALLFVSLLAGPSFADVYVIYNDKDNSVYSVSNQDDAIVPKGYTKTILQGSLAEYPLEYRTEDYTFENNKFIVNTSKISDRENRIKEANERQKELDEVDRRARKAAYETLKTEGKKFKYLKDKDF